MCYSNRTNDVLTTRCEKNLELERKYFYIRSMNCAYPVFFVSYLANVLLVGLALRLWR